MKVYFGLGWASSNIRRSFKSEEAYGLFEEYRSRISKFDPCEAGPFSLKRPAGAKLWLCHTSRQARLLSSEELALQLQKLRDSGARELQVVIGPADGWTAKDVEEIKPDLLWSFGPATYPHELASVLASEQIYRAYTILNRLPYHSKH